MTDQSGAIRVTILGCGGSRGVPVVSQGWGDCNPANPKNRRTRSSILVERIDQAGQGRARLLIDTSPDLREQMLANNICTLDAVLWTHAHADHAHGIDELREICQLRCAPLPAYGHGLHLAELKQRFGYCFEELPDGYPYYRPVLRANAVTGAFEAPGGLVRSFVQDHGYSLTLGYRIGDFAYSTDVVRLDEAAFAALAGVKVWVVDCQRIAPPHPVHAHLDLVLGWLDRVKPERAILTHMDQTMDYDAVCRILPESVEPAYDGMVIEIPG